MYGSFQSLEVLLAALESELGRPETQLEAIKKSILAGKRTEIGGHVGATLLFDQRALRNIGMNFRPPA
jgi:hypothetical protein